MSSCGRGFLLLAILSIAGVTRAHHNSMPHYDFSRTISLNAEVVRLELVNPHMRLFVTVTDADGREQEWVVDGPGRLSLARRGWTPDMFNAGDSIVVTGKPARSGRNAVLFDEIVTADGTRYLEPGFEDELAIEAQRRNR